MEHTEESCPPTVAAFTHSLLFTLTQDDTVITGVWVEFLAVHFASVTARDEALAR
jgi:hypothetical protein